MFDLRKMLPATWRKWMNEHLSWVVRFVGLCITAFRWLRSNLKRFLRISFRFLFLLPVRIALRMISSSILLLGGTPPLQKFLNKEQRHSEQTRITYHEGRKIQGKIAWIVSFTGVSNEPRVLRQSRALLDKGWTVVVVGYQGHTATNPDWHFVQLSSQTPYSADEIYYHEFLRRSAKVLCRLPFGRHWRMFMARAHHANIPLWRYHTQTVRDFARIHHELKADLVLAHDFHSCEVAFAIRDHFGSKISVDCHEYARGQLVHDPDWVKYTLPYVAGMHDYYLSRADSVTTVSMGIADLMNVEERLRQPAVLIRSMPFYHPMELRVPGERLTVIYHGDISYVRGLHKAIKSMPLWREEFDLLLRGNGDEAYIDDLRKLATELGLSQRVRIEGPVPFDQIIPRANEADIGYFVHYDASPQKRFVLPNKFFEYVAAGLALCVSDLPEMARLVREYDLGHLVGDYDEQKIAEGINAFTRENILHYKHSALKAAQSLNWEVEKEKLLAHYASIL